MFDHAEQRLKGIGFKGTRLDVDIYMN